MSFSLNCGAARVMFFCVAVSGGFLPLNAGATTYYSGHVSDSQGNPIAGAVIEAGTASLAGFAIAGQAATDQQGNYAITSLDTSSASSFAIVAHASGYVMTIYPNLYCADPSCLGPLFSAQINQPASGVDFTLPRGASISGHVTPTDANAPVANVFVNGHTTTNGDVGNPATMSDASGGYSIVDLPPGDYTWQTVDTTQLLAQSYAGHDLEFTLNSTADVVTLHEGQIVSNVDFPLDRGATLSGLLTSALNGAPVNAQVTLSRIGTSAVPGYVGVAIGTGQYQSELLAPGSFHVQFAEADDFQPLFYLQAPTDAQAQQVTLAAGEQRSGIDAQLNPTRTIAGTVTDASSGQPVQNVAVHAGTYISGIFYILQADADALTDASGNYLLQGLAADSYYIWADDAPGYAYTFYPGIGPCCDAPPAGASSVPLGASEFITGVNFALQKGAYASGHVYDADTGFVATGMLITVVDTSGDEWPGTRTDAAGTYTSATVPLGNYYLAAFGAIPPDLSFYYPDYVCSYPNCQPANAQLLQFDAAQVYPNLDLAIPHLDLILRNSFDQ